MKKIIKIMERIGKMKKYLILMLVLVAALMVTAACSTTKPVEKPTAPPTAEPTATPVPTATPTPTPEPTATPTPSPEPEPGTYDLFADSGIGDPETADANGLLRAGWKVNIGSDLCWAGPIDHNYGGIDPETEDAERIITEVELDDGNKAMAIRVCSDSAEGNYTALWNDIYNFPGLKPSTTYKFTVTYKLSHSPKFAETGEELRPCYIFCSGDERGREAGKQVMTVDGQWHTDEYIFTTKDSLPLSSDGETTLVDFECGPNSESGFMYIGFEILILKVTLYEMVEA